MRAAAALTLAQQDANRSQLAGGCEVEVVVLSGGHHRLWHSPPPNQRHQVMRPVYVTEHCAHLPVPWLLHASSPYHVCHDCTPCMLCLSTHQRNRQSPVVQNNACLHSPRPGDAPKAMHQQALPSHGCMSLVALSTPKQATPPPITNYCSTQPASHSHSHDRWQETLGVGTLILKPAPSARPSSLLQGANLGCGGGGGCANLSALQLAVGGATASRGRADGDGEVGWGRAALCAADALVAVSKSSSSLKAT